MLAHNPANPTASPTLEIDPLWEVHPTQLKQWLDEHAEVLIIDVRQPKEWTAAHIQAATLIPLDQLETRLDQIDSWKDRRVVVHCHHGVRSMNATAFLRHRGFTNVHSLAGGIDAWSLLADPTVPRY